MGPWDRGVGSGRTRGPSIARICASLQPTIDPDLERWVSRAFDLHDALVTGQHCGPLVLDGGLQDNVSQRNEDIKGGDVFLDIHNERHVAVGVGKQGNILTGKPPG